MLVLNISTFVLVAWFGYILRWFTCPQTVTHLTPDQESTHILTIMPSSQHCSTVMPAISYTAFLFNPKQPLLYNYCANKMTEMDANDTTAL